MLRDRAFYLSSTAILALAAGLHGFFFARGFYSIGWDESGRTLDAHLWAAHGVFQAKAWLPFYRICVGLGLKAFPDLVLTPRIITFFFGLAAVVAAGWLAQELFQNRKTTLLSLVLSTFFSQRVALSLAPLSDIMFIAVMLAAMASFSRWLRAHTRVSLFVCGFFGAVATTLRYEGWVFCAAMFLMAAASYLFLPASVKRQDLFFFGLILFAFPAVWVATMFFRMNPVAAVIRDAQQFSTWEVLQRNPLVDFALGNALTLNLIGGIAVARLLRRGEWRFKAVVIASFGPLLLVCLVLLLMQSAQTGPSWRMTGVWGMLLVPFTAYLLAGCFRDASGGMIRAAFAPALTLLVLAAFAYDTLRIERSSFWAFPRSDLEAGRYLGGLISADPDRKILIESSRYYFLNIEVASQRPEAFVENSQTGRRSAPILPLAGSIRDALEGRGIGLLAFQSEAYKTLLNQSPDVRKLSDFGIWSIYELVPVAAERGSE